MTFAWFVIVGIAALVLVLFLNFADRSQRAALDDLSNYRLPPASEKN